MMSAVEGTATLAVVNFRPEYEAKWMDLPGLQRLAGPARTGVDQGAPDRPRRRRPIARRTRRAVHERTGGNPFFIEEVVRELVEAGYLEGDAGLVSADQADRRHRVPAVQAILAARIDRLGPPSSFRPPR